MSAKSSSGSLFFFNREYSRKFMLNALPVGAWGRKETKPIEIYQLCRSSPWVIRASVVVSCPAASTCRSKIVLSLDWISFSFWRTEYLWPTKQNSETSTITNSGAGRLRRTRVCQCRLRVRVSSICFCSQSRNTRPQLLQRYLRAPEVQQSSH